MEDNCFTLGHMCLNDYGAEDEMQRDGIGNLHKYEQVDWLLNEERRFKGRFAIHNAPSISPLCVTGAFWMTVGM
jgi:hypothetical protein